ncbi:MAG: (2Fe-2S)-binding protein [Chloracidobacterium sp.]|nr:(2Fe-2S)-binding protein [Chloracidobacterium sp.]
MPTELIKVTINGEEVETEKGAVLIDVCRDQGESIPSFCYYKDLEPQASCRMCCSSASTRCRSCRPRARSSAPTGWP